MVLGLRACVLVEKFRDFVVVRREWELHVGATDSRRAIRTAARRTGRAAMLGADDEAEAAVNYRQLRRRETPSRY